MIYNSIGVGLEARLTSDLVSVRLGLIVDEGEEQGTKTDVPSRRGARERIRLEPQRNASRSGGVEVLHHAQLMTVTKERVPGNLVAQLTQWWFSLR